VPPARFQCKLTVCHACTANNRREVPRLDSRQPSFPRTVSPVIHATVRYITLKLYVDRCSFGHKTMSNGRKSCDGIFNNYCNQCVCLSINLSVRSLISKPHVQISPDFLYMLPVVVSRSYSGGNAIRTLCTSGFVDDVMFSHNGANRRKSKMTLCFVQFARWLHWGQSLPTATASRCNYN